MKKIIISLFSLSLFGFSNASEQTGELKSTAIMNATCNINANSLNFGVVASPLMAETSNSQMTVKCSNTTPYTIDLAYGGIYGVGEYTGYLANLGSYSENYNSYTISNKSGVALGSIICGYSGNLTNRIFFSNMTVANLYGYSTTGIQVDTKKNVCVSGNTQESTYPVGWSGAWNTSGKKALGSSYSYGIMNGVSKGDALAYSISIPDDSSKVWNTGNNSYKNIGSGEEQTIPINAKIVPDKSSSKYIASDMYLDTVTAIISY